MAVVVITIIAILVVVGFFALAIGSSAEPRPEPLSATMVLRAKEEAARQEIDAIYSAGIRQMNEAAGQSWRNVIEPR